MEKAWVQICTYASFLANKKHYRYKFLKVLFILHVWLTYMEDKQNFSGVKFYKTWCTHTRYHYMFNHSRHVFRNKNRTTLFENLLDYVILYGSHCLIIQWNLRINTTSCS